MKWTDPRVLLTLLSTLCLSTTVNNGAGLDIPTALCSKIEHSLYDFS